jgi:hypothetical protein
MMHVIPPRFSIAIVLTLLTGAFPAFARDGARTPSLAQERRGSDQPPAKGDSIIVTGCLAGPTLEAVETSRGDESGRLLTPITFQLKGGKDLLKSLRSEHDGKQVEVRGILKSNLPLGDARRGATLGRPRLLSASARPRTIAA